MNTNEHDAQHVTPAGRSVFADLFPPDPVAETEHGVMTDKFAQPVTKK